MACAICETRKPKRFCPGVRGDICSVCCGTEREVTLECPLDCPYLRDARRHERAEAPPKAEDLPHRDVEVTDTFINQNAALLMAVSRGIVAAALQVPGAIDLDVREALDALARTWRTTESGLYYETRPENPLAAAIAQGVRQTIETFRDQEREELGMARTRDADILGVLVFLHRLAFVNDNGRRRGRAFLGRLADNFVPPPAAVEPGASPLILT